MTKETTRRVLINRQRKVEFTPLYYSVYIPPWTDPSEQRGLVRLFAQANCWKANTPQDADIVVFGGGADVSPEFYGAGKDRHPSVSAHPMRDGKDLDLFIECYRDGIPMVGICRGAQFGYVMAGGSLYQDVNNHNSPHSMRDTMDNIDLDEISSVHHQACMSNSELPIEVIGVSSESTQRHLNANQQFNVKGRDIEAFHVPDMAFFGVQGHPEYFGFEEYSAWFVKKIEKFMNEGVWSTKRVAKGQHTSFVRLTKDVREGRKVRNKTLAAELAKIANKETV